MILDPETRRKDSLTVSTVFGFVFLFLLVSGEISVASRLDRIREESLVETETYYFIRLF